MTVETIVLIIPCGLHENIHTQTTFFLPLWGLFWTMTRGRRVEAENKTLKITPKGEEKQEVLLNLERVT